MNIESKLKKIRTSRKRRVVLPFHPMPIGGIDVSDELFAGVMIFIKALFKRLKVQQFDIEVTHWGEIFAHEYLCVSFRVKRSGTQWRHFPLDVKSVSFDNVMATIIKAMQLNVANLTPTVKHELSRDIHTIDVDDVVALIRYGAAKLGPDSQFASIISDDRNFLYVKGFTLDGTQLKFSSFNLRQYQYCLSPQSMKIIKMLIPDAGDTVVEFVS